MSEMYMSQVCSEVNDIQHKSETSDVTMLWNDQRKFESRPSPGSL